MLILNNDDVRAVLKAEVQVLFDDALGNLNGFGGRSAAPFSV